MYNKKYYFFIFVLVLRWIDDFEFVLVDVLNYVVQNIVCCIICYICYLLVIYYMVCYYMIGKKIDRWIFIYGGVGLVLVFECLY